MGKLDDIRAMREAQFVKPKLSDLARTRKGIEPRPADAAVGDGVALVSKPNPAWDDRGYSDEALASDAAKHRAHLVKRAGYMRTYRARVSATKKRPTE